MAAVAPTANTNTNHASTGLASLVKRGRNETPLRILLYGVEKIGKTSFAASAPSPIFVGTEDGMRGLTDTPRTVPHSWAEVLQHVNLLEHETHEHKTAVFDTVDDFEKLLWEHLCRRDNVATIEKVSGGYGKGYTAALEEWRKFVSGLDRLRMKGMTTILLGHSKTATFKNPEGPDYDRYSLAMHEKAAGLLKGWVDIVLFANFRTIVDAEKDAKKGKALGGKSRMLYTQRSVAWDAGSRLNLPESMPLSWTEFANAAFPATEETKAQAAKLRGDISDALVRLGDEKIKKATTDWLPSVGDNVGKLVEALNRLTVRLNEKQEQKNE